MFGAPLCLTITFKSVIDEFHLQIQAQDIHVGNLVWLRENDEVPCDLVLIGTSEPQGQCHVEVNSQFMLENLLYKNQSDIIIFLR